MAATPLTARIKATATCLYPALFLGLGIVHLLGWSEIQLPLPILPIALILEAAIGYWCRWSRREHPHRWRVWQRSAVGSLWALMAICFYQGLSTTAWLSLWPSLDMTAEAARDLAWQTGRR